MEAPVKYLCSINHYSPLKNKEYVLKTNIRLAVGESYVVWIVV